MQPKITDSTTWQQAELLMQPAFIRIIDNIRKLLDESPWKGTYHEVAIWSDETTEETKLLVTQLQAELETATPQRGEEIRQALAKLPMPHPGYHLCLQRQEQQISVDLWELCYQVCFVDYSPNKDRGMGVSFGEDKVQIDTSLLDEQDGIDWHQLDCKAKHIITELFAGLPDVS